MNPFLRGVDLSSPFTVHVDEVDTDDEDTSNGASPSAILSSVKPPASSPSFSFTSASPATSSSPLPPFAPPQPPQQQQQQQQQQQRQAQQQGFPVQPHLPPPVFGSSAMPCSSGSFAAPGTRPSASPLTTSTSTPMIVDPVIEMPESPPPLRPQPPRASESPLTQRGAHAPPPQPSPSPDFTMEDVSEQPMPVPTPSDGTFAFAASTSGASSPFGDMSPAPMSEGSQLSDCESPLLTSHAQFEAPAMSLGELPESGFSFPGMSRFALFNPPAPDRPDSGFFIPHYAAPEQPDRVFARTTVAQHRQARAASSSSSSSGSFASTTAAAAAAASNSQRSPSKSADVNMLSEHMMESLHVTRQKKRSRATAMDEPSDRNRRKRDAAMRSAAQGDQSGPIVVEIDDDGNEIAILDGVRIPYDEVDASQAVVRIYTGSDSDANTPTRSRRNSAANVPVPPPGARERQSKRTRYGQLDEEQKQARHRRRLAVFHDRLESLCPDVDDELLFVGSGERSDEMSESLIEVALQQLHICHQRIQRLTEEKRDLQEQIVGLRLSMPARNASDEDDSADNVSSVSAPSASSRVNTHRGQSGPVPMNISEQQQEQQPRPDNKPFFWTDLKGNVLRASSAVLQLLEVRRKLIIGHNITALAHPADVAPIFSAMQMLKQGTIESVRLSVRVMLGRTYSTIRVALSLYTHDTHGTRRPNGFQFRVLGDVASTPQAKRRG